MSKVVFCGFGNLGQSCLKELVKNGYEIDFVLTHKDLSNDAVDTFSKEHNIPFFYNDLRKNCDAIPLKKITKAYLLISINYRFILEKSFFSLFKYALNIHGSLLPKYRGRTPHVWSIINGEKYAGVTCHLIDEGIDTGNIVKQKRVAIDTYDTGYTLLNKYENMYPHLLINSLDFLEQNGIPVIQDNSQASFFGKREPIMGYIDFYQSSDKIINFIRAQAYPYPGAYCYLQNGEKLLIDNIEVSNIDLKKIKNIGVPVLHKNDYYIKCNDRILKVIEYRRGAR